jgi:hypothetical protein
MDFEENEVEVAESFFPSTAFMSKVDINYNNLFINLWY